MSGGQLNKNLTGTSLDEYDRFFDAHNTFELEQRTASSHKLPIGELHEAPTPYNRESVEDEIADHHSAAYYPHAHQTLHCSSSERRRRRKKKEKSIYKSNKASRPSRLFQPSLDEVSEQRSICSTTSSSSSEHGGLWFGQEPTREESDHDHVTSDDDLLVYRGGGRGGGYSVPNTESSMYSAVTHLIPSDDHLTDSDRGEVLTRGDSDHEALIRAEPSPAFNNNALTSDNQLEATTSVFEDAADAAGGPSDLTPHPDIINRGTPGAADTMDGIGGVRLAVPKHMVPLIKVNQSAPNDLQSTPSVGSTSTGLVKFSIGGEGSMATISDEISPGNVIQSRPYNDSVQPLQSTPLPESEIAGKSSNVGVKFILGAESSENLNPKHHGAGVPTISPLANDRRHSTQATQSAQAESHHHHQQHQQAMQSMLKGRSYSYHPGDDLAAIRCRGSDVELTDLPNRMITTITTPEEAAHLNKHDLEGLATHRFEYLRGYGKHKINKRSAARLVAQDAEFIKPAHDLTPHELFVELDELVTQTHDETTDFMEWKEKARWIKFEEDVLDTSERWGRPHVASLSFHSLIELRRLLENGLVTLDVEIHDYVSMMQTVVDLLVISRQLSVAQKDYVMQALVLRHSHLDGKAKFSRSKSYGNLRGLESMSRHSKYTHIFGNSKNTTIHSSHHKHKGNDTTTALDQVNLTMPLDEAGNPLIRRNSRSYDQNMDREQYNMELLKKIPEGSEVASVLVGTLKDLEKPCVVFLRLSQGVMLDHVAEVPLPVRFLFVCIGPALDTVEYLEIGRSLSTLMSNKPFREAAYGARDRQSILTAMNAFLDDSMVLPPGDFDRKTLLPIMHMAKKKLKQRREKEKALREQQGEMSGDGDGDGGDKSKPPDDPLGRTGRAFGGLVNDIKRKVPHYMSDIKDGLNGQVFATFVFIYFACLSPAITFGGLLGEKTDNYMGASEMLMATSVSGILFSLLSGQPLLITGFTGPNMVFEEGIYKFSDTLDIDFLAWRFWIGVWIFIFSLVMVATEASYLVKYVTRFTEEIFAFLISMIFLYEVLVKLIKVFKEHPLCEDYDECLARALDHTAESLTTTLNASGAAAPLADNYNVSTTYSMLPGNITTTTAVFDPSVWKEMVQPNTALLTMTLTVFTFVLAYYLKGLRNKKLLGRTMRRALGDFGVPLAILMMCVLDYLIGDRVYTQKLSVPAKFSVSDPTKRGWIVNPLGKEGKPLPIGHVFSAFIPALLGSILIFMESLIAGVIVDKKENKLQKGSGFHLDILVLGFSALINGVLGVPFVCAATVRSVAHTSALTVVSRSHAPGEHPKLEKVIEQRVSNFLVHVLIAISMFLGVVLRYIPTAVLFGVFLYMGIASLGGIQLFDRIILLITPTKHHPVDIGYVRFVRARKMHLFTIIQVFSMAALWAVKLSPAALAFPFVLILLVPVRLFLFKYLFSDQELEQLDSDDDCKVLVATDASLLDDDLDFYDTAHMPD